MDDLRLELRRCLGDALTLKVLTLFAGQDLYIPSKALLDAARRNREIIDLRGEGLSTRELSERFGVSLSQVRRIAAGRGGCRRTLESMRKLEDRLGSEDAWKLAEALPGRSLYIPLNCKAHDRARRNAEIRASFNGSNSAELVVRYGLSRRQIYEILKGGEAV